MVMAAAAALTFCTPGTGTVSEPAAVVQAFVNAEDDDQMAALLTADARVSMYGEHLTADDVIAMVRQGRFLSGPPAFDRRVIGSEAIYRFPVQKLCLRETSCEPVMDGSNGVFEVVFQVSGGCVTEITGDGLP